METKINSLKLTDAPYSAQSADAFEFDDEVALEQFLLELEHARPGSYLLSGYRGSGKTSFVNRVASRLPNHLIVELNISKAITYPALLKKIIRQLYLQFEQYEGTAKVSDKNFSSEFKLLYDRTFHDITKISSEGSKDESKKETKLDLDIKKLIPYVLILWSGGGIAFWNFSSWPLYVVLVGAIIWACVSGFTMTFSGSSVETSTDDISSKSLYDDEIAEHHLFSALDQLKTAGFKILIVFDELDKLQDNAKDPKDDKIGQVINDLKPLLLSGYASFMVVAGQSLYYQLERALHVDDSVVNTLFSKTIHIPFLKNATLKKFSIGLISDQSDKSNLLVNNYFDTLILKSRRIPRKLVNLIRAAILWDGPQAKIKIDEDKKDIYQWKARILQAVSHAIDNELASEYDDVVQLDFYTSQSFIWISRMMPYTIPFKASDFFDSKKFTEFYPETYTSRLYAVWNVLTEALLNDNLIKIVDGGEDQEFTYKWLALTAPGAEQPDDNDDEADPKDENPDDSVPGGDGEEEPDYADPGVEVPQKLIKESLFLTDLAELEAYVRTLFFELEPNVSKRALSLKMLIEELYKLGVLNKTWNNSSKLDNLMKTRGKIAHGLAIGEEDLNEVRNSTKNIAVLRAEINEQFTYYVAKLYLRDIDLQKSTKGGFDFLAVATNYHMAIEVKSSIKGKLDSRTMNEIIDKYSNYQTINKVNLYLILFFYQPPGRKSMDDFYINFNKIIEEKLPHFKSKIQLFYITTANERSIKNQVENGLNKVLNEISSGFDR